MSGDQSSLDKRPPPLQRWWDQPPWNGAITEDEFRRVVDLYIAHYGYYSPGLPVAEPEILDHWRFRAAGDGR